MLFFNLKNMGKKSETMHRKIFPKQLVKKLKVYPRTLIKLFAIYSDGF